MTYSLSEDMETLYMVVFTDSKKYKNIASNNNVSVLVDNRQKMGKESDASIVSITFEGISQTLQTELATEIKERLAQTHPELGEIANDSGSAVLGIKLMSYKILEGPVQSEQGNI
jgi:nitroimidazol reductase NimA-like FMN-containing flavoprotein (pyridoxamine 5'-phosphate oxidase superfamily)